MEAKMLTPEEKNELKQLLCCALQDMKTKTAENGDCTYKVPYRDEVFFVEISDEDLEKVARLAIEMLEELKSLANSKYNRKEMDDLLNKANNEDSAIRTVLIYESIQNDKLKELANEAAEIMRVGGAYWMLIARPALSTALFVILNGIIDCFDDEDMYNGTAYLLLRAILSMHKVPIDQEDDTVGKQE
ncbi:hypothetical protein [Pseudobutyrivibrio sp. LB2011]|uniref:hypothetical protein n=1 Tax=Pseudobutyrivibrio sp. LB2011 TaxID=1408312 RepID=UPI0005D13C5A|nr:hypothetical protein [Pseudobutyrivibrio sp. LB2011]